jgi:prolipoprotein diacylglyceryl transferase
MYPRFSDILNNLFGTNLNLPIQTYGFFVALAFIAAGFLVYHELKRKEKAGLIPAQTKEIIKGRPPGFAELFFTGFFFFIPGFKISGMLFDYQVFTNNPQNYLLSLQGNLLGGIFFFLLAIIIVYLKGQKEKLAEPIKVETVVYARHLTPVLVLIAAFTGILGAKLFDMIEHLYELFRDPIHVIFSFSGLTFYGGLIVAALAVGIYGERNKIKWPIMADTVAPALMLAYAIGRIGCQLSGDGCWGIPNLLPKPEWLSIFPDWMWAFDFPRNVINQGIEIPGCAGNFCHALEKPVFPTSFYETVICSVFFLILWFIRKKLNTPGLLFSIYLILNGLERFTIEQFRVNIRYTILNIHISQAQIIAGILILAGLSGLVWLNYQHQILKIKNASKN